MAGATTAPPIRAVQAQAVQGLVARHPVRRPAAQLVVLREHNIELRDLALRRAGRRRDIQKTFRKAVVGLGQPGLQIEQPLQVPNALSGFIKALNAPVTVAGPCPDD